MLKRFGKTLLATALPLLLTACPSAPDGGVSASGVSASAPQAGAVASAAGASAAAAPASASAQSSPLQMQAMMQALMQAVFGPQYRAASNDAVADLPDVRQRTQKSPHRISAVAQYPLENGQVALICNAQLLDANGNVQDSHASAGLLGVYLLQNSGSGWQVVKKHENVAELGSSGSFGEVERVTLAPGRPGIVVHGGGTWQGYTVEEIAVFDLSAERLRDLTGEGVLLHSDSEGACLPETEECWNITGQYRFVPGKPGVPYQDLQIDFSGEKSVLAEQASAAGGAATSQNGAPSEPSRKVSKINVRARYAWDGQQYRLVQGENPVPRP